MSHNVDAALVALRAARVALYVHSQARAKLVKHKQRGVPITSAQITAVNAQIVAARAAVVAARDTVKAALLEV